MGNNRFDETQRPLDTSLSTREELGLPQAEPTGKTKSMWQTYTRKKTTHPIRKSLDSLYEEGKSFRPSRKSDMRKLDMEYNASTK